MRWRKPARVGEPLAMTQPIMPGSHHEQHSAGDQREDDAAVALTALPRLLMREHEGAEGVKE